MNKVFESNSLGTIPPYPSSPSIGYPTKGNVGTSTPATNPGEWWYYMMTQEILNVVVAGGVTPDGTLVNQLLAALNALYAPLSVVAAQPIKAWLNFDGSAGSPTPRASLNIASITKNGTGDYTIAFTTPMADTKYSVAGSVCASPSTLLVLQVHATGGVGVSGPATTKSTTAVRIILVGSGSNLDSTEVSMTITR